MIKKRKLDDENESSVAGTSSGSITCSTVSVILKPLCVNIMKTTCPSYSFHLDKSSQVQNVLLMARNWQTKMWFQVS
jgi:hypothetical protein